MAKGYDTNNTRQPARDTPDWEQELLDKVGERRQESTDYRSGTTSGTQSLEQEWERAGHFYVGNHWRVPTGPQGGTEEGFNVYLLEGESEGLSGIKRRVINKTQTAVIANVSQKTRQSVVPKLEGLETNDEPEYFLSKRGGKRVYEIVFGPVDMATRVLQDQLRVAQAAGNTQLQQEALEQYEQAALQHRETIRQQGLGALSGLTDEQMKGEDGPVASITEEQADAVKVLIEGGQLDNDDLHQLTDEQTAKDVQTVLDTLWEDAGAEQTLAHNVLMTEVYGSCPMRVQWHTDGPRKHTFELQNDHLTAVYPDPYRLQVRDMDYFGVEYLLDADLAKTRWPDLAETIEKATNQSNDILEGRVDDGQLKRFQRPVVIVLVMWLRHQKVPMTEREAVDEGVVVREPVYVPLSPEQEMASSEGAEISLEQMIDEETGKPMWRYYLAEEVDNPDAEPVEPTLEVRGVGRWPTTTGVQQVTLLPGVGRVVQNIRCAFYDIPVAWNLHTPRPVNTCYGMGTPRKTEDVQKAINRAYTIIDAQMAQMPFPQRYWPNTVLQKLQQAGVRIHGRPGTQVGIDDEDYYKIIQNGGFNATTQQPPVVPPVYVQILETLFQIHDDLSGNVDVRRGEAPYTGASGTAIQNLQQQAVGPLAYSSKYTEWAVERIVRIVMDAMLMWLPESEWQKRLSKYELPVLRRLIERAHHSRYNVRVTISTGRGASQREDAERALAFYDRGLLSRESAMEQVGITNTDEELRKLQQQKLKEAQAQAPVQAAAIDQQDTERGR